MESTTTNDEDSDIGPDDDEVLSELLERQVELRACTESNQSIIKEMLAEAQTALHKQERVEKVKEVRNLEK